MSDQFKFKAEYETEVYINHAGGITIKQERECETAVVSFVQKERIHEVAKAMIMLSESDEFGLTEEDDQ